MLQKLFEDQRRYLNAFFDAMDVKEAECALEKLLQCPGILVLTGVGKSGHIAQKIATTLVSTGTRASFLSPAQALHGDIGFLSSSDALLALSKSGESQELIDLMLHAKKRGVLRIAVVSESRSRLAQMSDLCIHLPIPRELCPYDLAPTTSTAAQLIFGDCLAIALMQAKGFTEEAFAANHPAGFLGRKLLLRVADVMLQGKDLPLCRPEDRLLDVLCELSVKRCGCLLIVDPSLCLLGIFTDGDLRRAIEARGSDALQRPLGELMTPSPLFTSPEKLAMDAIRQMEEEPSRLVTVLPVLEGGRVAGLLRMHDILQAGFFRKQETHS